MPETSLEYRFRWDAAEHRRFYRALRAEVARSTAAGRVVPLVILVLGVFVVADARTGGRTWAGTGFVFTLWLAIFVASLALLRAAAPYLSARAYRREHRCINDDQVRVLSATGVEARCEESTTTVKWSAIRRAAETPDFFLFFTTPRCAIQLPKRCVPDPDALREFVREHLGERAEIAHPATRTT
jgi:hypothetical protein